MKILFVITKSEIGGAQVFVLNLVRSLKKLGYEVEVVAGHGKFLFEELKKNKIAYYFFNSLKRDVSIRNAFYFIYDFYKLLKNSKYDIIHLNSSNALLGAFVKVFFKKKPKIIFTFHGLSLLDRNYQIDKFIKSFARIYFKFFLQFVDNFVFVSESNYKESLKYGIIKSGSVIYNGLDINNMNFISSEEGKNFFSNQYKIDILDSFIIGSTGRLAYQKNFEFLIDNFYLIKEKIPNVKIIIIGNGPNYKDYITKIKQLNIQNDFFLVGSIKNSFKYIKAFDIFVLPSRYEGLSISLIEAVFAGIPILASDVGGNSEIVGNDSSQLFKLNDIDDFITKLIKIKNDPTPMIEYNRRIKNKFTLDKMVSNYVQLYESLLKKQ